MPTTAKSAPVLPLTLAFRGGVPGYVLGSMGAASATLTLASSDHSIKIGHRIIVEIGGEAGGGEAGTVGVGGTWPAHSFATDAALLASGAPGWTTTTGSPAAYALDTGNAYYYDTGDSTWKQSGYAWQQLVLPLALRAVVKAVSGATLTLDTAATVATTDAKVWVDSREALVSSLAHADTSCRVTEGTYALGDIVSYLDGNSNRTLSGDDKDTCGFISPRGVASMCVTLGGDNCENQVITDLTFDANTTREWIWDGKDGMPVIAGANLSVAVSFGIATNCTMRDVISINSAIGGVSMGSCSHSVMERAQVIKTYALNQYMGIWGVTLTDCFDCQIVDSSFESPFYEPGLELFRCDSCSMQATSRNGQVSSNGNTNCDYDVDVTIEADAMPIPTWVTGVVLDWNNNIAADSPQGGSLTGSIVIMGVPTVGDPWNAAVGVEPQLDAGVPGPTFHDLTITTGGTANCAKAIDATTAHFDPGHAVTATDVTADGEWWIPSGTLTRCSGTTLFYCGEQVTITDCDFDTLSDQC